MSDKAQESRERILDATAQVLVRDGADGVTIAAVARQAEISKGGLFYHFASKELLVDALVARYIASFDELIATAGDKPGAATLAYLHSATDPAAPATGPVIALLTAAVVNPRTLVTLRERYSRWQERLDNDGIPVHLSSTIRFAVDGLWLADAFDLAPAKAKTRADVIATLASLLEGTQAASN